MMMVIFEHIYMQKDEGMILKDSNESDVFMHER
jgi:hypothetical protein